VLIRASVSEDYRIMILAGTLLECYGSPVVSLGNRSGLMLWTGINLLIQKEMGWKGMGLYKRHSQPYRVEERQTPRRMSL
jgi:hypothetical protein